jgi:hypothetical protein
MLMHEWDSMLSLGLQVNAGYYAMEQANPRHEHEWSVWEDIPVQVSAYLFRSAMPAPDCSGRPSPACAS